MFMVFDFLDEYTYDNTTFKLVFVVSLVVYLVLGIVLMYLKYVLV